MWNKETHYIATLNGSSIFESNTINAPRKQHNQNFSTKKMLTKENYNDESKKI